MLADNIPKKGQTICRCADSTFAGRFTSFCATIFAIGFNRSQGVLQTFENMLTSSVVPRDNLHLKSMLAFSQIIFQRFSNSFSTATWS
jgi:hypothetical protein